MAAATELDGRAHDIGAVTVIRNQAMRVRSRQEQQRGFRDRQGSFTAASQFDRPALDEVNVPTLRIALEVVDTANLARVEDTRAQRKAMQQQGKAIHRQINTTSKENDTSDRQEFRIGRLKDRLTKSL